MTGYLYQAATRQLLLTIEHVRSFTNDRIEDDRGGLYGPFAEGVELSLTPDLKETRFSDWTAAHPSADTRLDDLETLVAQLLFGGETV